MDEMDEDDINRNVIERPNTEMRHGRPREEYITYLNGILAHNNNIEHYDGKDITEINRDNDEIARIQQEINGIIRNMKGGKRKSKRTKNKKRKTKRRFY